MSQVKRAVYRVFCLDIVTSTFFPFVFFFFFGAIEEKYCYYLLTNEIGYY